MASGSSPSSGIGSRLALALALTGAALLGGCKTPDEYREEADSEVYAILKQRREQLGMEGAFTIEPPPDSLRQRLIRGEVGHDEEVMVLTLTECLEIAAENSRDYQFSKEDLYLSALDLTLERFEFQLQSTGTLGVLAGSSGADVTAAGATTSVGFTKLMGNGALLVADLGIDILKNLSLSEGWNPVANVGISFTQPLLRGYGRSIVQEPLTQAERNVVYSVRTFERFRRTFAFDVTNRVYRVLELVAQLENERKNYDNLITLRTRNEALEEAGRMSDIQVDQARQDELRARNRVVLAQRDLQAELDTFKFFLGLPIQTRIAIDPGEVERIPDVSSFQLGLDEDEAIACALAERLDYRNTTDQQVDAMRKVRVASDALRAGLDFEFDYNVFGTESEFLGFNEEFFIGATDLTLDLPLVRLPERNAYRATLVTLERATRAVEQAGDQITVDLRDQMRDLEAARRTYEIQANSVVLAERRVESAFLNLEAGRASTRDVLEAQEALVTARNARISSLIAFAIIGLSFYRDLELLRVDEEGLRIIPPPEDLPELSIEGHEVRA